MKNRSIRADLGQKRGDTPEDVFFITKIDWVGATASIDSAAGAVQICQRRTGGVSESDTFVLFPGKMAGGRNG